MSRRHLTSKQLAFLEFLRGHLESHKIWPTYREIVDHFDYRSPNSVTQNLQALSRKGYLRRDPHGYQLVDRSGGDGSIAFRGGADGSAAPNAAARLTLAHLFPDIGTLAAYAVDDTLRRDEPLAHAAFVLVAEGEPLAGEPVVAVRDGWIGVEPAGQATGRILGRYAGHAGTYGVLRTDAVGVRPAPASPVVVLA